MATTIINKLWESNNSKKTAIRKLYIQIKLQFLLNTTDIYVVSAEQITT